MRNLIEVFTGKPKEPARKAAAIADGTLTSPIVEFDAEGVRKDNFFDFGDNTTTVVVKSAEGRQRELLLQDCARCLAEGRIGEFSYIQFVGNMIQLLGGKGKHESGDGFIESNQLNVGDDTSVNFYRNIKGMHGTVRATSGGVIEHIDHDGMFFMVLSSSIPLDNKTFYSPVSEKQEPFRFGFENEGHDEVHSNPYRFDNGQGVTSFLRKTLSAFINTQET